MSDQIAFISARAAWRRMSLALTAVLVFVGAWYGLRWCVGNTMAEYARDIGTARSAARLAPADPLSHLMLARLHRVAFLPEELPEAMRRYEEAVALAPHDYRTWMEMGRARSSLGDPEGGVVALRRAVDLAPHYAQPRWHFGNALLRVGRVDEAFAELRRAADADPALRPQAFNLAWQVYDQDMARVIGAVGQTPEARAQLVAVLLGRGRPDDALAVWSGLSAAERRERREVGEKVARAFFEKGQYRRALEVFGELEPGAASAEKFSNGGFESDIPAGKRFFQWHVTPASPGVQVAIDPRVARGGSRSLRVAFNAPGQADFNNVSQLVAVEPATRYRLSFYVRTGDLSGASTLVTSVSDAADSAALASSEPVPAGTNDWQQAAVEFTTGPRTEAVVVRLARADCATGVCPIYGKIWYDDFDIQRLGGLPGAR